MGIEFRWCFVCRVGVGALIFTNVWTFWQFGAGIVLLANRRLPKFSSSTNDSPSHIPRKPSKIPTKPVIPTLWWWCYSAGVAVSPSKSPMKPLMTRIRLVLHPWCDGACQWAFDGYRCYLRKISQNFPTTMPLRLRRMPCKRRKHCYTKKL